MDNVKCIAGQIPFHSIPSRIYSDEVCAFLHELSKTLFIKGKEYSDVVSFAFWCRKGNIQQLKAGRNDCHIRLGKGVAFHITPSNIPVNFAFSFAFGLLSGNCNIVRIPSKPFEQVKILCEAIGEVLEQYPQLQKKNALIHYNYDAQNQLTREFSHLADVRMIWGGDATVQNLQSIEKKHSCVDISFPDRYSFSIINGMEILKLTEDELKNLARQFYNDTFFADQNACSSPRFILWLNDSQRARNRFWDVVYDLSEKKYDISASLVMDKYLKLCSDILELPVIAGVEKMKNRIFRIELTSIPSNIHCFKGYGGYFYECPLDNMEQLSGFVNEKYQTVTCFGIEPQKLRDFIIQQGLTGIDRIVPIGSALDIGVFWDGFDLISTMSRIITTA